MDSDRRRADLAVPIVVGERRVPALAVDDPGDVAMVGRPGDVAVALGRASALLDTARDHGLTPVPQ
jgi:hypothetical protein